MTQPLQICIGPTIRIGRESWCLPYAGFFLIVWNFLGFFGFFCFFGISFKVTNVTTKSYQGYYWTPKIAKNGPKQHNKLFFARRAKKASAEGRSPPQELEVGPRSGPYLLVILKDGILRFNSFNITSKRGVYFTLHSLGGIWTNQ